MYQDLVPISDRAEINLSTHYVSRALTVLNESSAVIHIILITSTYEVGTIISIVHGRRPKFREVLWQVSGKSRYKGELSLFVCPGFFIAAVPELMIMSGESV